MAKKTFTDESLITFIENIKSYSDTNLAAAKTYVESFEFITVDDIDTICGATIYAASEVTY